MNRLRITIWKRKILPIQITTKAILFKNIKFKANMWFCQTHNCVFKNQIFKSLFLNCIFLNCKPKQTLITVGNVFWKQYLKNLWLFWTNLSRLTKIVKSYSNELILLKLSKMSSPKRQKNKVMDSILKFVHNLRRNKSRGPLEAMLPIIRVPGYVLY
jgi:hypothetical protein